MINKTNLFLSTFVSILPSVLLYLQSISTFSHSTYVHFLPSIILPSVILRSLILPSVVLYHDHSAVQSWFRHKVCRAFLLILYFKKICSPGLTTSVVRTWMSPCCRLSGAASRGSPWIYSNQESSPRRMLWDSSRRYRYSTSQWSECDIIPPSHTSSPQHTCH